MPRQNICLQKHRRSLCQGSAGPALQAWGYSKQQLKACDKYDTSVSIRVLLYSHGHGLPSFLHTDTDIMCMETGAQVSLTTALAPVQLTPFLTRLQACIQAPTFQSLESKRNGCDIFSDTGELIFALRDYNIKLFSVIKTVGQHQDDSWNARTLHL